MAKYTSGSSLASTNPPSSETRSVGILPTKSGYRNPVTKQVHYEKHYSDALSRLDQDIDDRIEDWRGARWIRKKLESAQGAKSANKAAATGNTHKLEAEITSFKSQIKQLRGWEADLITDVESITGIINDFRLVFPVDEISSVSIYREEVNIEYFSQQEPAPPSPEPALE